MNFFDILRVTFILINYKTKFILDIINYFIEPKYILDSQYSYNT